MRFSNGTFSENYLSTLGSQIFEKDVVVDDSMYNLVTWDLGGQDQFRSECRFYIMQAYVVIIAFAVNDMASFVQLKKWREYIDGCSEKDPNVMLVANKIDLRGTGTSCVTTEQVNSIARKLKFDVVLETSAKTGTNISKVFKMAAELCHSRGRPSYVPMSIKKML